MSHVTQEEKWDERMAAQIQQQEISENLERESARESAREREEREREGLLDPNDFGSVGGGGFQPFHSSLY